MENNGKRLNVAELEIFLIKRARDAKRYKWDAKTKTQKAVPAFTAKALREFASAPEGGGAYCSPAQRMAAQLYRLNEALAAQLGIGADGQEAPRRYGLVYAHCSKAPRGNLDTGRHYFNVYFVDVSGAGDVEMVNPRAFGGDVGAALLGLGARDNIENGFFSSGAIGMSRLLDATDALFSLLRAAGGFYAQIDAR